MRKKLSSAWKKIVYSHIPQKIELQLNMVTKLFGEQTAHVGNFN